MNKKVVLAFSGGLDTSFCVKYLTEEKNMDIYSVIVNTGGFSDKEIIEIENKAYELGVKDHKCINITKDYYKKCIKYMVYGNMLKNNTYPLSVSSERTFQAIEIAKHAQSMKADYIAHGSTGAGNDQIRFDLIFQIITPETKIITPTRDLNLSREEEIDYLKKHGSKDNWEKAIYSINQGLWGTSIGGKETLSSNLSLPDEAYPSQPVENEETTLTIHFNKGEICGVNDNSKMDPVSIINKINNIGNKYAIGRDTHVGDTIIGIKGRVGFEASGPLMIIKSHHLLEKHVLTKWQQYWKEQLSNWYGMLLHEGQYLEPVMRNIEKFLEDSQLNVTGKVFLKLSPYRFEVTGIESDYDLMNPKFGHYGETNKMWTSDDVKGFTKIMANSFNIYNSVSDNKE